MPKQFLALFILCCLASSTFAKKLAACTIQEIVIEGNVKTKTSVILRELSFSKNEKLTYQNLLSYHLVRSEANLKNLDLFNKIEIRVLHQDSLPMYYTGGVTVQIKLIEKWYLWPIPFVEFSDRNVNQWYALSLEPYRTNYGMYLFKNNLWGLNHTAKFTFGFGYTNTAAFQYIAPYIDKKKRFGFNVDIRRKTNREIQYQVVDNKEQFFRDVNQVLLANTSVNPEFVFRPKLYAKHSLGIGYLHTNIADTIIDEVLNPDYLVNGSLKQELSTIYYTFEFDKQNNIVFPTKGFYASATTSYNILRNTSVDYTQLITRVAYFYSIPDSRLSLALNGAAQLTSENRLPFTLSRGLGYDFYVRGYENNVILGTDFGLLKYEARYTLIKERHFNLKYMPIKAYKSMPTESYMSFFFDHGFCDYKGERQLLQGYGIGLNSVFYFDKVFRFEYSWNKAGQAGIKVHFKKAF